MASFERDGIQIGFDVEGAGDPVLLIHGFASTRQDNWQRTGWYGALTRARRQIVAVDLRGHGESSKLHDPARYGSADMIGDLVGLLDHLDIKRADIVGFSMGAGLALQLGVHHDARCGSIVAIGVGGKFLEPGHFGTSVVDALRADDPSAISDRTAQGFRLYADQLGQDREALVACASAPRGRLNADDLGLIRAPTLIVAGQRDELAGDPAVLAAKIPGAKSEYVPGCDHMFALTNPMVKGVTIDFLTGWI